MTSPRKVGLRERKKLETRLAISDVATRLFIERGFDRVTVAEVAEAANVSVNTIFNYFSTKEELFFDRAADLEDELARAITERRPGESAVDALERHCREAFGGRGGLLFRQSPGIVAFLRTIEASPSLRARQLLFVKETERRVAATLAKEVGAKPGDVTSRAVAAMMMGLLFMLVEEFRDRALRGESSKTIRSALRKLADRGFAMLRDGAGDFARRPV